MRLTQKSNGDLLPAVDWVFVAANVDVFVTSGGNVVLTERKVICSINASLTWLKHVSPRLSYLWIFDKSHHLTNWKCCKLLSVIFTFPNVWYEEANHSKPVWTFLLLHYPESIEKLSFDRNVAISRRRI